MRRVLTLVVVVMLCAIGSGAHAGLFQDDFQDSAWTQANWQLYITQYVSADNYSFVPDPANARDQVFRMVAGPASPAGGPEAGGLCNSGQTYFVDNMAIQVDIDILSGGGAGLFWGLEEVPGNDYYLIVSPSLDLIQISEEPYASGQSMIGQAAWDLDWSRWYTVKVVCTGTNFEVWFNERGLPLQKIFDVPQDQNHLGFQNHVRGECGVYAENDVAPGPSTALVDNFVCDALETPAEEVFEDGFEDSTWTLNNWEQLSNPTVAFENTAFGRALRLTAPAAGDTAALIAGNGKMYFCDTFTLRAAPCVGAGFQGGIAFGLAETTPGAYSDYFLGMNRVGDDVYVEFVEEENNVHHLLASATVTGAPDVYWYNFEVLARGEWPRGTARFRVSVWPRSDPKPSTPAIDVRQDVLHQSYRLLNLGGVAIWQDSDVGGLYDDFYLQATSVPVTNTEPGQDVTLEPGEDVRLTFQNVDSGGSTEVLKKDKLEPALESQKPKYFDLAAGHYYDISTSATYTGDILISITYDDSGMSEREEQTLRLWHWDTWLVPPAWVDVTTGVDTVNNVVYGVVSHLSVFAIAAPPKFDGFLQPMNMPPQEMSVFKAGSTIPVKFRLRTFFTGQIIDDAAATIAVEYLGDDCQAGEVNEEFSQVLADGGNTFRYDAEDYQYIFNLKTKDLMPGLYRVHACVNDGLLDKWVDVRLR